MIQIGLCNGGRLVVWGDHVDCSAVDPSVLAYGLSYVTRFGGQAGAYSVAEHSCRMYDWAELDGQAAPVLLAILIHDAPECLGEGDCQRFVKRAFGGDGLKRYANMIVEALWRKYRPLPWDWSAVEPLVKQYDERIGAVEARQFGFPYDPATLPEWLVVPACAVPVDDQYEPAWRAKRVESEYLYRWEKCCGNMEPDNHGPAACADASSVVG